MKDKIFLVKEDDELIEMEETEYEREIVLQELLEKYPSLLVGEQMYSNSPRRWLLVSREMGIAFEEDGARILPVDHLFLDQEGIPTLIEVKRRSDTRIRREVVGQMLDYAANAVRHLKIEEIMAEINENDLNKFLSEDSDLSIEPERFWQKVKINLQAGKIRMVFVADIIPKELKTIVEFLNEQMDPADVLAVEIKQFIGKYNGQELKTLVPRVIGQTMEAQIRKSVSNRKKISEDEFLKSLDPSKKEFFEDLIYFANKNDLKINWGTVGFSMNVNLDENLVSLFEGYLPESKFKNTIIVKYTSILGKVKDGESIINLYSDLKDFAKEGTNGLIWRLENDNDREHLEEFKKVLSLVINKIKENGLK
ncbi:MAG: hypothetical protein QMD61_07100 [Methanobacterium sp.]|nr:hypothetical protein [Methanobacterium sp.]